MIQCTYVIWMPKPNICMQVAKSRQIIKILIYWFKETHPIVHQSIFHLLFSWITESTSSVINWNTRQLPVSICKLWFDVLNLADFFSKFLCEKWPDIPHNQKHLIENIKSTCNWRFWVFKRTDFFKLCQKERCVLLLISHCDVAYMVYRRIITVAFL